MVFTYYNPNPVGKKVGDCAVRAIAKALNTSWRNAYSLIVKEGYEMCDMPSGDSVWGSVLQKNGFHRKIIPNTCPNCYTAEDFCLDHQKGIFVLAFGGHVATVVNGKLYDSWDSSQEIPQYFWYRKER